MNAAGGRRAEEKLRNSANPEELRRARKAALSPGRWRWDVVLGALVAACALALLGWIILDLLPPRLASSDVGRAQAESDARTALVQALGGLLLLAGLVFTGRTLQLNRQGQITDRFTKAVDQLGSDTLDVRLGGIYALERLARDSPGDHPTIMEVLTAYLREHASSPPPPADPSLGLVTPKLRTDLQAALTVLGRRRSGRDREEVRLDLSSLHLEHARLVDAQFHDFDFSLTNLTGARLIRVDLSGARLGLTQLPEARLMACRFDGANLATANLMGAILCGSELAGAENLDAAFLEGAKADGSTRWPAGFDHAARGVTAPEQHDCSAAAWS
jgi:hypothetical protein